MLEFAKTIHEAIGIQSPRLFIAAFALTGMILFGLLGWVVDRAYRVKVAEQSSAAVRRTAEDTELRYPGQGRPPEPPPTTSHPERVFLPGDVDPKYLTSLYRENTSLQADAIARNYIGKWMKLSVAVEDIERGYDGSFRIFSYQGSHIAVGMVFTADWGDRVSVLRRGSQITVVGILHEVDSRVIHLRNCELITAP